MKTLKKLWRKLMWLITTRTTWQWRRRDFTQVRVGPGATYQTGAQKLTYLYTKVVEEGSSVVTPVPGAEMMAPLPLFPLPSLSPVANFLCTLPVPSTHPTHPAAQVILTILKEGQRGYAYMRGNWSTWKDRERNLWLVHKPWVRL